METVKKVMHSGRIPNPAPAPSGMRSGQSYPGKKGKGGFPAPNDHPQYGVDGVGGQDQRGSKRTYPSKKSGNTFRCARGDIGYATEGVAGDGGDGYGVGGV